MKDEAIPSDLKSSLVRVKIILAAAEKVIQNMKYSIENTGFKKNNHFWRQQNYIRAVK